ncbi:plastid division protein PDV1 [Magnolia sinica]|uniref:plastid division protein PDV1 n=1 Tax=Magnolia sinica TaxID=86752 RepID=UPI0026584556|nr:plastid division protein PDV1 [Magnolia sinica]
MISWEMEMEEIETVLEKIWDIHDKLSDAIHAISRSHFLSSIKSLQKYDRSSAGFVYAKDFRASDDDAAIAEARSLNAIRTALENLEDQLEFFHTVQSQQRAERDAAIARLEQSRIVLAMRLADHHGKKYKVIEEALAFVGDVHEAGRFVSPENLFEMPRSQSAENLEDGERKGSNVLMQMFMSCFTFAKKSLKLEHMGGVLGHTALVAVSMLALLQLHQVTFKSDFVLEVPQAEDDSFYRKRNENVSQLEGSSSSGCAKHLDVLLARG